MLYAAGNPLLYLDPHGLSERRPCDDLAKPNPCGCDQEKLIANADLAIWQREIFCNHPLSYRDHFRQEEQATGGQFIQVGGFDWDSETDIEVPWFTDVGDPCMN